MRRVSLLLLLMLVATVYGGATGPTKHFLVMSERDYLPFTYTESGRTRGVLDGFASNLTPDDFEEKVIAALPYADDKKEVREALGL